MQLLPPYSYAGLLTSDATKVRNSHFYRKVKNVKNIKFPFIGRPTKHFYEEKLDQLIKAVEELTCVTKEELLSYSKKEELAEIRHIVIAVAFRLHLGSQKNIGKYFGGRDHTSARWDAERGHELILQDKMLNDLYKNLVYCISNNI